jgi:hypothetical protein
LDGKRLWVSIVFKVLLFSYAWQLGDAVAASETDLLLGNEAGMKPEMLVGFVKVTHKNVTFCSFCPLKSMQTCRPEWWNLKNIPVHLR